MCKKFNKRKKILISGLVIALITSLFPIINQNSLAYGLSGEYENDEDYFTHEEIPKYKSNPFKGTAEKIANAQRAGFGIDPGIIHKEPDTLYYKGSVYQAIYNEILKYSQKSGKKATSVATRFTGTVYGGRVVSNIQIYNGKIYFETALGASMTDQDLFSCNLNGSNMKKIVSDTLYENKAQSFTVYKGKLYGNSYYYGGKIAIRSFNLDGSNKKTLIEDNITGFKSGRKYSYRAYSIYKDRIYFIKTDGKLYSMDLNGKNKKTIGSVNLSTGEIDKNELKQFVKLVSVYNGYAYYTTKDGLCRMSITGKNKKCILEKYVCPTDISIYGNKIAYTLEGPYAGLMDTDGSNKKLFPSGYFTAVLGNEDAGLIILNENMSMTGETIIYNSPSNKNSVKLWKLKNGKGYYAWNKYSSLLSPYGKGIASKGPLKDGTYYISSIGHTQYTFGISAASKDENAKLILWDRSEKDNRKFKIKKVGTNKYTIIPVHSKKPLTSPGIKGKALYQSSDESEKENQVFTIVYKDSDYRIYDKNGYSLDIPGSKYSNGTNVSLWDKNDGKNQKFLIEYI